MKAEKTGHCRVGAWARVLALAFCAVAALPASAGFSKTGKITGNARKRLENGTVYTVAQDGLSVKGSSGWSGLYLDANSTAVLYIPAGMTLKVTGGSASDTTGAGAGIEIPSSSTLVVTGGGTLEAYGGKGEDGDNGGDGGDGQVIDDNDDPHDEYGKAGKGGSGGAGGGGAGAGIGGNGGSGGVSQTEPETSWVDTDGSYDYRGYNGYSGNGGGSGGGCGTLFLLGDVTVKATGGDGGSGGSQGVNGKFAVEHWTYSYRAGGGGGGGGGAGGRAGSNFGGGGGGGGAGGGGGSGGTYWTTQGKSDRNARGGNGEGGYNNGGGSRSTGGNSWGGVGNGGDGGYGGSVGGMGAAGTAYKTAASTALGFAVNGLIETHSAIEYTLTFDDGARLVTNMTARFGHAVPTAPMTHRYGHTFQGWYTGENGAGTQFYEADGSPVAGREIWTVAGDLTLYPKYDRNTDDLSAVTLYINGTEVVDGTDKSGDGWNYKAHDGKITITGANKTYEIHGCDVDGFAQIEVTKSCTIKVASELAMYPGTRGVYTPLTIALFSYADVVFEVAEGAHCELTASRGNPAIYPRYTSTIAIKAKGPLEVKGGENAADIGGPASTYSSACGKIYVETYDNWFANVRSGNGTDDKNWLVNNKGYSAEFYSYATSNRVYSVRMPFPGEGGSTKTIYRQRILGEIADTVITDAGGNVWLWVPNGNYEWAEKLNASYEDNDRLWTASVNNEHTEATSFTPLNIKIDGEDIAHLYGSGWYTESEDANFDKVRLVITNAGHIVTGSGNARITMACSGQLTVTNLTLDASSWKRGNSQDAAFHLEEGVNLELKVEGKNSFSGPTSYPGIFVGYGSSLTIDGDGELIASGGSGASGIGGSWWNYDTQLCGDITINGGRITAIGGQNCAGIGDAIRKSSSVSYWKRNGRITINGGVVTARGGKSAAGVGGGSQGYAYVTINGGTVFATAGDGASAIGDGASPSRASTNTFGLAAIYLAKDEVKPSPKNSAGKAVYPISFDMEMPSCKVTSVIIEDETKTCKDIWTDETGKLTLWLEPTNGEQYTIKITAVDADDNAKTKVWGYKMDDEGGHEFSTDMLVIDNTPIVAGKSISDPEGKWDYDESSKILKILSGTHTITGSSTNGSINVVTTGSDIALTLDNLTLKTTLSGQSPFVISNNCTITLAGDNTIECIYRQNASGTSGTGSEYTAAVEVPKGASLVINGEGTLVATAGFCGAGIGSRGAKSVGGSLDAGSITIKGGKIYATGGWGKAGGGAGIGGGNQGGVESVLVTGGYVHATGGKNACGIGTGNNGPLLADSTFHVTGGTVMVEKGDGSFSDFTTACGSVVSPTGSKAIVIDGGCSVRPKSFYGQTDPYPNPVDSNGVQLVYAIIHGVGLEEGETVRVVDSLWPQYNDVDVYADEDGAICIWGMQTNTEHTIRVQSASIEGAEAIFTIGAASNTVQTVSGGTAPDSREIDGKTCWRVEVHALPIAKRMSVSGDVTNFVHSSMLSDRTGKIYLYLPNGEYDFRVGDYTYHAAVAGAATTATYRVGILVGGRDIGEENGTGWTYDGTAEKLTLLDKTTYQISGTNSERKVSVCVAHEGAGIRSDRLVLNAASRGPFYLDGESTMLEFKGGTISTAKVSARTVVSGGSLGMELPGAVARIVVDGKPVYTNAYRVTIGGLARYGHIEIEGIEEAGKNCLAGYDTADIWADTYGKVYLYLPDGDYFFKVADGAIVKTMVAIVDGGETTAIEFEETGITINGREAARIRGAGWINEDGLVSLTDATTYVIAGTNFGAAVTFAVAKSGAALSLDHLVMTNAEMSAAAFAFGDGDSKKQSVAVMMYGTNVVHGAEGLCAMQVDGTSTVTIGGDGVLDATGGGGKPAIGGDIGLLSITGGTVVVTCGSGAAAIGSGQGKVSVSGGILSAAGGISVGEYVENGGTVVADDVSAATTVDGGSLHVTNGAPAVVARNSAGDTVYCVTIPTGRPNFDVGAVMGEYDGYPLTDVITDADGKIYIWLPNGTYYINIGRVPYRAVVDGADALAEMWSVGVEVNGEDVALRSGEGWTYDVESHALSIANDGCTVSGTNTAGEVYLACGNDIAMTVSNLVLATSSTEHAPIDIASNVTVAVTLMGENGIASSGSGVPAVRVPWSATLAITNIDSYVFVPDLDDIKYYTNTVESIEEEDDGHGGTIIVTNYVDIVTAVTNYEDVLVSPVLTLEGGYEASAMGGGYAQSHGTIEIAGGIVSATGGQGGAGIGSGEFPDGTAEDDTIRQGEVRITGGKVIATGGRYGAAIGGGARHTGGTIVVFGGEVEATGGQHGAGLGGGCWARGYRVSVSGGRVTAVGGQYGAGIGGGYSNALKSSEPPQIAISGGQVAAIGGEGAAGIGAGSLDTLCAAVNITGGTVVATGGDEVYGYSTPDDIGIGGFNTGIMTPNKLTIKGASVHATHRTVSNEFVEPSPSNGTERVWCVTIATQKTNELVRVEYVDGFGDDSGIYADADGKIYLWLPNGTHIFSVGNQMVTATVSDADATAAEWFTGVTADGVDVARRSAKGKKWGYYYDTKTLHINGDCVVSGTDTAGLVCISASTTNSLSFTISNLYLKATSNANVAPVSVTNGTVTVRLAGTNRLDARSTSYYAGLEVAQGATLILTNLEENAEFEASGGDYGAGIGGNRMEDAGIIEIWGGRITANGGYDGGAGVGGGVKGNAGTININCGSILARGGNQGGAGIGSGYHGRSGNINISGGRIQAFGGYDEGFLSTYCGAGIGGGDDSDSSGCSIAISGGTILAGAGNYYDYGATKYAADIGNGYSGNDGYSVRITGGSIKPLGKPGSEFNQSKTDFDYTYPADSNGHETYQVTVGGFTANAMVYLEMSGYGSNDIYADASGNIYIWLANGDYIFTTTDGHGTARIFKAHVAGGSASAEEIVPTGFTVNGRDVAFLSGEGWIYNDGAVNGGITLSGLDHYVLSGALTNKYLNIGNSCSIVFSNVVFNSFNIDTQHGVVDIDGAYDVNLTIEGENRVIAPPGASLAGIRVHEDATLAIDGGGSLESTAGPNAAGIGGTKQTACGTITVNGGTVTATGGNYAAGIGAGFDAGCGSITINGGNVTANGGIQGAGIGGGAFTGGTSVGGTYAGDITITGGVVVATGGNWAAGIGGGEQSSGGSVAVKGGKITAQGGVHGPAIGACGAEGTYGDVTISGGTVVTLTNEYSFALGRGRDTAAMGAVTITGGSVDAASYNVNPAPSNGVKAVSRIEVSGFAPGAAVAFNGLPDYYGKADIFADAGGNAYLWLPDDWTTPVTPKMMAASSRRLFGAGTGTSHTFSANGYSYTVEIPADGGDAVAEKGDPLPLESLDIDDFAVEDGYIVLRFTAKPATWLYGFSDLINIRASATLPIADGDSSLLDLSGAELYLEGSDAATIIVPLADDKLRFFRIVK